MSMTDLKFVKLHTGGELRGDNTAFNAVSTDSRRVASGELFVALAGPRTQDVVQLAGRTYEVGLAEGVTSPYPTLKQYVFSRTIETRPDPHVELVADGAVDVVRALKQQPGRAIWLCGGSELATTLFSAGLVDRLIVKLNPVLFGAGIPLLGKDIGQTTLALTDTRRYASGHVLLYYSLER